ncbi:phosphotransferase family protein [Streptosporangium canum]|uniref:phosphotransferase family protein n=1 Tax=Streptosporangium canum TaxID=324952 RepID=UPI0037AF351B
MGNDFEASIEPGVLDLLSRHVLGGVQVVDERRLTGGFSSDNVLLRTNQGVSFVLRRYPRRNTCAVEAALMRLVADRVPAPEVVYADNDGSVLGEPFILTRFVSGVPLTAVFAGSDEEDGAQLGEILGETLAAISSVRFGQPGFFADGDLHLDADPPEHHDDLPAFVEGCLARGNAAAALSAAEQRALVKLAADNAPLVAEASDADHLVHSDFNAKNVLLRPGNGRWRVSAVLDWEYAFSGSPLFDVGNMLRFPQELSPGFGRRFPLAYQEMGGPLPERWKEMSEALELFALSDLLTRSADHPLFAKAVTVLRRRISGHT